jgi:transposase
MLSMKEAQRLGVIEQVLDKRLTQVLAAQQLGVSVRQVKRLSRAVREQGAVGLVSKRRGQPSNRRIDEQRKDAIMTLVCERYADFGPQLACEYLAKCHEQRISAETLRGWMVQEGLWQAKNRRAKCQHPSRPRRECLGELVQIDGSHHDWFEGRASKCCLIAFIDDATGRVLAARFSDGESTQAYFAVLHQHVSKHGVPLAYYSDRHSIFTKHDSEDPKPTQFERALLQLQIEPICAHSPQAKGRVERLFQTLQDRLCKAMRLEGISSIEQANAWLGQYMAEHNARFAVAPRQPQDAHRAYTGDAQALARICSLHHQRQLSNDQTCQFEGAQIWIKPGQSQAPKGRAKVDIAQYADGHLEVLYQGQPLAFRSFVLHPHLQQQKSADYKSLNQRVDAVGKHQREQLKLKAQIELQQAMRQEGIYSPDTHPSAPLLGLVRYGLRPSQPSPSS